MFVLREKCPSDAYTRSTWHGNESVRQAANRHPDFIRPRTRLIQTMDHKPMHQTHNRRCRLKKPDTRSKSVPLDSWPKIWYSKGQQTRLALLRVHILTLLRNCRHQALCRSSLTSTSKKLTGSSASWRDTTLTDGGHPGKPQKLVWTKEEASQPCLQRFCTSLRFYSNCWQSRYTFSHRTPRVSTHYNSGTLLHGTGCPADTARMQCVS